MTDISENLKNLRSEYKLNKLSEETVNPNPFSQFKLWFDEVITNNLPEANSMVLSTVDTIGKPSARIVLLKSFDESGLVFCTNYNSKKGRDLEMNSNCSLLFYWPTLERQIRIEGTATKISEKESKEYFYSRPKESQIAALISNQSIEIENRNVLEVEFKKLSEKYGNAQIPKPEHWGGYKVIPGYFEFWQGREFRLHDRIAFKLEGKDWKIFRLSP